MARTHTSTLIGAGLGLALFLAIGLLPAVLYGGYAGLTLASGIFGTPLAPTLPVRALIIFGMVMGVTAVASLFTLVGAILGAMIYTLTGKTISTLSKT